MFLDYGYRSECCYAPLRMAKKKIKNTKQILQVWQCCNCLKKDVRIVKYNKNTPSNTTPKPQFAPFDTDEEPVVD